MSAAKRSPAAVAMRVAAGAPGVALPVQAAAVAAALWLATAAVQAQTLRDLLRQALPTPQSIQQAQRKAEQDAGEARCRAVVDWAGTALPAGDAGAVAARSAPARRGQAARGDPAGGAGLPPQVMLFADEVFVPVFGKPFDALSPSERVGLYRSHFEECLRSPTYGAAIRQAMPRVAGPFQDIGQAPPGWVVAGAGQPLTAARVSQALQRMRGAGGEVDALLRDIDAIQPGPDGWAAFQARRQALDDALRFADADARAAAPARVAAAAQRLALPQARRIAEEALAAGTGFARWGALRDADERLTPLEPYLPPGEMEALRNPLRERVARLLDDELQADRRRLDLLPGGAAGLQPGAEWLAQFNAKYDPALRGREPFARLAEDFRQRRDDQLQAAAPALQARLRAARSEADVRALLETALAVRGDTDSAVGQQLLAAAGERREALAKASVLGEQARERPATATAAAPQGGRGAAAAAPADDGGGRGSVVSTTSQREPTASEMYDIIKSRFDTQAQNVKDMTDRCKGGGGRGDPASAVVCLSMMMAGSVGADEPLRITKFEKLGCDRASGKAGYVCDYLLATTGRVHQAGGALLAEIAGRGGAVQARFLKTRDGWIAFWGER